MRTRSRSPPMLMRGFMRSVWLLKLTTPSAGAGAAAQVPTTASSSEESANSRSPSGYRAVWGLPGADGVLMGTRFCVVSEALASSAAKARIVATSGVLRVGDLVLWDDGFTKHRRTTVDPG